jgi:hypothetical protein
VQALAARVERNHVAGPTCFTKPFRHSLEAVKYCRPERFTVGQLMTSFPLPMDEGVLSASLWGAREGFERPRQVVPRLIISRNQSPVSPIGNGIGEIGLLVTCIANIDDGSPDYSLVCRDLRSDSGDMRGVNDIIVNPFCSQLPRPSADI